jgi:predicted methyltransferase
MKRFSSYGITTLISIALFVTMSSSALATGLHDADALRTILDNPKRDQADKDRDVTRKPAKLIEFMGTKSGMTVLDLMAGSGYYTEILSGVVGPKGHVVAHTTDFSNGITKNALNNRAAEIGRMSNVEILTADINNIELEEDSLDAIYIVLGYHDFYYMGDGWDQVQIGQVLGRLHSALKPQGSLVVVDHGAGRHAPTNPPQGPHGRISKAVTTRDFLAAGFKEAEQATFLENSKDDGSLDMFDPAIRGKTSRYIIKFTK